MQENLHLTRVNLEKACLWKDKSLLLNSLDIELTERCNNNCIHCYINLPVNNNTARQKELSTETIKEILKEAVSLGCLKVRLTGGEPLLREDFEELYIFARQLGLKVLLFTNATLITTHLAELFVRIPPLENIEITIYGMKKKSYEAVTRTPGSYEAAQQGMRLLLEKEVPFVVKGVLVPHNMHEMIEFEKWVSTIPWMTRPPSYSMFFDLRCHRDSEEKNHFIKRLRLSPEQVLEVLLRRQEEYLIGMKMFCSRFTSPPGDRLFSCSAGKGSCCLDAYGHLQACMMLRHPATIYDLKKGSLKPALTNFFPKVRKLRASNLDYLRRCARCFLKGFCEQCPAKSWAEHGTLDTPVEYFCKVTHIQARYLGLLKDNEHAWEVKDWRERIEIFTKRRPVCTTVC